jgi:hypothetical protein
MTQPPQVLETRPLAIPHNGTGSLDEQGVFASAFSRLLPPPEPVPLYEFPFFRAWEPGADFGVQGDQGKAWGYHFGRAFTYSPHPHFERLSRQGMVLNETAAAAPGGAAGAALAATRWLGNVGQWGAPGWSTGDELLAVVLAEAAAAGGCTTRAVLELGTSRGRVAAALSQLGCGALTTVDAVDRGAAGNLAGLGVRVVRSDADAYLEKHACTYDLVVVDMHGNDQRRWARLGPLLEAALAGGGTAIVNNARLYMVRRNPWGLGPGVAKYQCTCFAQPAGFGWPFLGRPGAWASRWGRRAAGIISCSLPLPASTNIALAPVPPPSLRPCQVPGWEEETGASEWLKSLPRTWSVRVLESPVPGLAVVRKPLGSPCCNSAGPGDDSCTSIKPT